MRAKIKVVMIVFAICLMGMPMAVFASNKAETQEMKVVTRQPETLRLKRITVEPKELNVPKGTSEDVFRNLIEVTATYKRSDESKVVTDYQTDYEAIKDEVGPHKVTIVYEENGCKAKTIVCVQIIEASTTEAQRQFPYVSGYEDKTFRADQPVTREELATMMARLLTDDQVPQEVNTIPDLSPTRYSTDSINYITKLGIMSTYSDGSFKTKGPVTWTEFNEILRKLEPYVGEVPALTTKTTGDVTRAEAVTVLNQLFGRDCSNQNIENPYTDLTPSNPAYQAILCASVGGES